MSYAAQLASISGVDRFLQSPTCYNGKVYAMTIGPYDISVKKLDILVKEKEVVISLLPFMELPSTLYNRPPYFNSDRYAYRFLKGSCTELFYIAVIFITEKVIDYVYLFKLDITSMMWEEMEDLKDAILFLELYSDYSTCYYRSAVDSVFGGYVHILDESGEIIFSFHPKDRTISISSMPCLVRESQATSWAMIEWRLEVDHVECMLEAEGKDTQIVVRLIEGDDDFDGTTSESHLLNIPIHILEIIMEQCIGIEYMAFRATSKHCYLAAPLIQWSTKTTLKRLHMYSLVSPWLMVFDNCRGIITFIDPLHGDKYFIKTPPELKDNFHIYCSRYGWLLMYHVDGPMVFYNPFTSDVRELPMTPYLESFCFSAPPTSPNCIVVGLTNHGQLHVFIYVVSHDSAWRVFSLNFCGDDPYSYRFPTFSGRDVYALCNNTGVDIFRDMAEVDYSWEAFVKEVPRSHCKSPTQYFMSMCDQHLLLVIVGKFGESVEVFKLNESEEWEKTYGLGKHMIYVSDTSCICLEAKSPEMENKIYFPRLLHEEDTKIVFYSLETCRYHTFDDKNIEEKFGVDLFGTKHHCYPHTWIEPNWS